MTDPLVKPRGRSGGRPQGALGRHRLDLVTIGPKVLRPMAILLSEHEGYPSTREMLEAWADVQAPGWRDKRKKD